MFHFSVSYLLLVIRLRPQLNPSYLKTVVSHSELANSDTAAFHIASDCLNKISLVLIQVFFLALQFERY